MMDKVYDNKMIVSFGADCKSNKHPLQLKNIEEIYTLICKGDDNLIDFTKNLRAVLRYSKERYRAMKTSLPFFSCSIFEPSFRSIQYFKYAIGLIVDIDYPDIISRELVDKFKKDPRIAMGYISPSHAGAKFLFWFDRPVTSAKHYAAIYRHFSHDFATQYHVEDCIDLKNCDVSRISFICYDPEAWYLPDAIPLPTGDIIKHSVEEEQITSFDTNEPFELPQSVYKQILEKLGTKPKSRSVRMPFLPDISEIIPEIAKGLISYDIVIKKIESIQYGAKIKIYKDKDKGELNIYHGKQGYRVVTSPRKGTQAELNEVAKHIIEGALVKY